MFTLLSLLFSLVDIWELMTGIGLENRSWETNQGFDHSASMWKRSSEANSVLARLAPYFARGVSEGVKIQAERQAKVDPP